MIIQWCSRRGTYAGRVDYETDTIIQESLRQEVAKDVTLLTIAHRLQTIMDSDKIVRTATSLSLLSNSPHIRCRWCWTLVGLYVLALLPRSASMTELCLF